MKTNKTEGFENNLEKLEKIVQELEGGKFNLEVSLGKFEEGVSLYKDCKQTLSKAEKRIKILTDKLKEEDFE